VLSQSVLETGVIESWQGCFMLLSLPKFPLSYLFSLENPLKGYIPPRISKTPLI